MFNKPKHKKKKLKTIPRHMIIKLLKIIGKEKIVNSLVRGGAEKNKYKDNTLFVIRKKYIHFKELK